MPEFIPPIQFSRKKSESGQQCRPLLQEVSLRRHLKNSSASVSLHAELESGCSAELIRSVNIAGGIADNGADGRGTLIKRTVAPIIDIALDPAAAAVGSQLKDGAVIAWNAAVGPVQIAGRIKNHGTSRRAAVGTPSEGIDGLLGPSSGAVRGNFKHYAVSVPPVIDRASDFGRTIQIAGRVNRE